MLVELVKRSASEVLECFSEGHPTRDREPAESCVHKVSATTGGFEVIDKVAVAWRELCDNSSDDQPFYRPEFVRAYVRAFIPNKTIMVIAATDGERLDAVLPLVSERALLCGLPVRRLRAAANVHSCRFDLVRRAGPKGEAAAAAVWRFLKELPGWDVLEFSRVPGGGEAERMLSHARNEGFPTGQVEASCGPYLSVPRRDSSQGFLQSVHSSFRQNVRRSTQKLEGVGKVHLRWVENADSRFLEIFYDLERAGWKGKKNTAIACSPATQQFYTEIAQAAEQFGYLSCCFLELDDRVVAGHFGFAHSGRYYLLKPAYDEDFHRYSPGQLLVHYVLQDCAKRGLSEFDFLPPWSKWKGSWTLTSRGQSNCYVFHSGFYGELLTFVKFSLVRAAKGIVSRYLSSKATPENTCPGITAES